MNNNINIRFIFIFMIVLGILLYVINSDNRLEDRNNSAIKTLKNKPWAEGNYKKISNLDLDVNAVQKALLSAEDPKDFENKVNAIYQGQGTLSIEVESVSASLQKVHLYLDKKDDYGKDTSEKILTLERHLKGNEKAEIQAYGHGAYSQYSYSPFLYSLGGSLAGSMIGNWLTNQSYQNYQTPASRKQDLSTYKSNLQKPYSASRSRSETVRDRWNQSKGKSSWNNKSKVSDPSKTVQRRSWSSKPSRRSWGSSRRSFSFRRR